MKIEKYIKRIKNIKKQNKTNLTDLEKVILIQDKKLKRKDNYIKRIKETLKYIYEQAEPIMETTNQAKSKKPSTKKATQNRTEDNSDDDMSYIYTNTNTTTLSVRQKENNQKKERIKQILKENKINDSLSNLDTLETDILKEILVNKPQGQPPAVIKKVLTELNKREQNEKETSCVTETSTQNRKRKNKSSNDHEADTQSKKPKSEQMNTTNNLNYSLTIECESIQLLKDTNPRKQQDNVWSKIQQLKLKGIKHASMIELRGKEFLKITTNQIDDISKIENIGRTNDLGKIKIINKEIESRLRMICYGFKQNYNEEDEYETEFYQRKGITRVTRKLLNNNEKARSITLEIKNNEAFCDLYVNGLTLNTEKCNCEPKWKHVKFCKKCTQWDHYEDDCTEDEIICFKCGSNEHNHTMCREEPHCSFCEEKGLNSNHLTTDENECSTFKEKFEKLNENYLNILKNFYNSVNEPFEFIYPKNMNLRWHNSQKRVQSSAKAQEIEKKMSEIEMKHKELQIEMATKHKELRNEMQNMKKNILEQNTLQINEYKRHVDERISGIDRKLDSVVNSTIKKEEYNSIINENFDRIMNNLNLSMQQNMQLMFKQMSQNANQTTFQFNQTQ